MRFSDGNVNYFKPATPIIAELPPNEVRDFIKLQKLDPSQHWGDVNYEWEVTDAQTFTEDDLKQLTNNNQILTDAVNTLALTCMVQMTPEDDSVPAGMKACPQCTLHNPISATMCNVCLNVFN